MPNARNEAWGGTGNDGSTNVVPFDEVIVRPEDAAPGEVLVYDLATDSWLAELIKDANVAPDADIDVIKLEGGTEEQLLQTLGGVPTWVSIPVPGATIPMPPAPRNVGDVLTYDGDSWESDPPASQIPLGSIFPFAGPTAPAKFLLCNEVLHDKDTYLDLWNLIGYTYGGSGTQFRVPNLKGKVPVGLDGTTEFSALAQTGGDKKWPLSEEELAAHSHRVFDHNHNIANTGTAHNHFITSPSSFVLNDRTNVLWGELLPYDSGAGDLNVYYSNNPVTGIDGTHDHGGTTGLEHPDTNSKGSGTAHQNLQPYIVINYIIKALI